jgi:IPT/TIG domain/Subtilase family/Bacterial Ig-like domain (group 2)
MTSSRISLYATLVVICLAGGSVLTQRAGSIDTITPAAARPGDSVTITGRGFGAINVSITVDGVPAAIVAANGNSVTFRVPEGVPQGATTVTAINPGGQSGSIAFHIIEGVLLSGDPNALATSAETLRLPTSANRADLDEGLILTRLDIGITPNATVGQVNAALLLVNGGIDSMHPGGLALTIAIPRQPSIEAIEAIIDRLRSMAGIAFAFPGRESAPLVLPPGTQAVGDQVFPTRFPAAWNAKRLALQDCTNRRVTILVPDDFTSTLPAGYATFSTEIPPTSFALPDRPTTTATHGYDVITTMAAAFNGTAPTGANPFVECLDIIGVNLGGLTGYAQVERLVSYFPATRKFLINHSRGYLYQCPIEFSQTLNAATCNANWVRGKFTSGFARAMIAAEYKYRTRDYWNDFLAFAAAGNANGGRTEDGFLATIYLGVSSILPTSMLNSAVDTDPFFGFAGDHQLWDRNLADPNLPSSFTADASELTQIHDTVVQHRLDTVGAAPNVVLVGSTTAANTFGGLRDSSFSNIGAFVAAVGEQILTIDGGSTQGTSFATPQVTGLASLLWLLSDELRNSSTAIALTRRAIEDNARTVTGLNSPVIDAYASILSLDRAQLPSPSSAPVRLALLDTNDDTFFTEADIDAFLAHLLDSGGTPLEPLAPDYSRFDLNGDGFTGGTNRVESFDLDRIGSQQFGKPAPPHDVTQTIEGNVAHFDEGALTDLKILCYYAYSALYTGDPTARTSRLGGRCSVSVDVTPSQAQVVAGATAQFAATVHGSSDPRVTWTTDAPGATISNTGLFTAGATAGTFAVTATSVADPNAQGTAHVTITGSGPGHGSGDVFASASGEARSDPNCPDLSIESPDNVASFSRSLHCAGHFTGKPPENQEFSATGDATTTFSETDLLGELTSATATGVYVTTATALGAFDPNLPPSFHDNAVSEAKGSYQLAFTVSRTRTVRLTGTLTGNTAFLQFGCGDVAFGSQAGAGAVDRTFTLQAGQICAIDVEAQARSRANPPPQTVSPVAGFALHVEVH